MPSIGEFIKCLWLNHVVGLHSNLHLIFGTIVILH